MYSVIQISDDQLKSNIADIILRQLPEWFGIEESTANYVNNVSKTIFFAAYDSNELIGFISVKFNNEYTAEVYVIGVLKAYHNKGIGEKLLSKAEKFIKERECKFLMVKTLGESHPDVYYKNTRKFYAKAGFYPLEEIKGIWGKDNPCLLMVKNL